MTLSAHLRALVFLAIALHGTPLPFAQETVWRRDPGGWRLQLDIWNSLPEPGS